MALIYHSKLDAETIFGVWKIEENYDELISKLYLNETEMCMLNSFGHESRKIQWLSTRALIRNLLNPPHPLEIVYDENQKPSLVETAFYVSISHSKDKAAVLLSRKHLLGIDIEYIHPKIEKVAHKFMHINELTYIGAEYQIEKYHIFWGAKEALYKLNGKAGLNFKDEIFLHPFVYLPGGGSVNAEMLFKGSMKPFVVNYMKIRDYMLVYVVG